jgi:hypothetical protein
VEKRLAPQHATLNLVRWASRLWSIVSVGLVVGFIVGEGITVTGFSERLGFLFFPVGISIGMILAWWKEGLGGSITVGSLLAFYAIHFASAHKFPPGGAWLVLSFPGFLFLLCSCQAHQREER